METNTKEERSFFANDKHYVQIKQYSMVVVVLSVNVFVQLCAVNQCVCKCLNQINRDIMVI